MCVPIILRKQGVGQAHLCNAYEIMRSALEYDETKRTTTIYWP